MNYITYFRAYDQQRVMYNVCEAQDLLMSPGRVILDQGYKVDEKTGGRPLDGDGMSEKIIF